jgi:putative DNA methylase
MSYITRLIEVDLPIKRISAHARREKSIRHGHISTLHIWWARRPLAACRAVILAALWPDPADPLCPPRFLGEARKALESVRDTAVNVPPRDYSDPKNVRAGLLDSIAEFANWDNATNRDYLTFARDLVQVAHEALGGASGTRPLVVDPFAGGGAIPLEALRVGADAFASDLNPVAVLLNKVVLEYIPKYGQSLADEVRKWGGVGQGAGREGDGRVLPKGPRRLDADRLPLVEDNPLRGAGLRGRSASDPVAVVGEEGQGFGCAQAHPEPI